MTTGAERFEAAIEEGKEEGLEKGSTVLGLPRLAVSIVSDVIEIKACRKLFVAASGTA